MRTHLLELRSTPAGGPHPAGDILAADPRLATAIFHVSPVAGIVAG
jgi:hypothetical protein